jgi:hypothetical protein
MTIRGSFYTFMYVTIHIFFIRNLIVFFEKKILQVRPLPYFFKPPTYMSAQMESMHHAEVCQYNDSVFPPFTDLDECVSMGK